jgi:hypothetical protein
MSRWIFVVLLAASQTVLHVHEAEFALHADHQDCTLCLLAHGIDDAVAVHAHSISVQSQVLRQAPARSAAQSRRHAHLPLARAPPQSARQA